MKLGPSIVRVFALALLLLPCGLLEAQKGQSHAVTYKNREYRFTIKMPSAWAGYSVHTSYCRPTVSCNSTRIPLENDAYSIVVLDDPRSTKANPRQDIPIMVFPLATWKKVESEDLIVSAAPVPPEEIGRNAQFVFATPPRYTAAELPGADEVRTLMSGNPLQTF
jgi:hypothetical protein